MDSSEDPNDPAMDEKITCQICQNPYLELDAEGNVESPKICPCGHIFGSRCLRLWGGVNKDFSCPMCRVSLCFKSCEHAIMPLPMSFSKDFKPLEKKDWPHCCVDCEHNNVQGQVLGIWDYVMEDRDRWGKQTAKLLSHWDEVDFEDEEPLAGVNARINLSVEKAIAKAATKLFGEHKKDGSGSQDGLEGVVHTDNSAATEGGQDAEVAGVGAKEDDNSPEADDEVIDAYRRAKGRETTPDPDDQFEERAHLVERVKAFNAYALAYLRSSLREIAAHKAGVDEIKKNPVPWRLPIEYMED